MAVEEFKKMAELKISKNNGGYSKNTTLIFNLWLKNIDMFILE